MEKIFSFILPLVALVLFCEVPLSPIDPDNPDYEPPSFIVDKNESEVSDGDSVGTSSVVIVVKGNMNANKFRWRLDDGEWSEWEKQENDKQYTVALSDLDEPGEYIVGIETRYNDQEDVQSGTVTLYRLPQQYTVSYDGNGETDGEVPVDDQAYIAGAEVIVNGNSGSLEKEDQVFIGWNTRDDGYGTGYLVDDRFTMENRDMVLYAQWSKNKTFTVSYEGNGETEGTAPYDPNNYENNATVTVRRNESTLEKDDATFVGWNTEEDGTGTGYKSGEQFIIKGSDVTLYAQWTSGETFNVTYNENESTSGEIPVDENNYKQGMMVTVLANSGMLEKEESVFIGWNTEDDGSGESYIGGSSFEMEDADVTLYAQWSDNEIFTVTYDANGATGGSVPVDLNNYIEDATATVLGNSGNLVNEGNVFIGWNSKDDGSGTMYSPGITFTVSDKNVTLYALWSEFEVFNTMYNGNENDDGTVPVDVKLYEVGDDVVVLGNNGNLSRPGFSFSGWNTAADGSGTMYAGGALFEMGDEDVTLYAQWSSNSTYKVTYDGNGNTGGEVPTDENTYETGEAVAVRGNTGDLVSEGKVFTGWNTAEDGDGTLYSGGETFEMGEEDVILYAQWTVNPTFTVTYDGNGHTGGEVPDDDNNYESEATITVRGNTGALVKMAATFSGWNTAADGSGTTYGNGDTFKMGNDDVTLYAQWMVPDLTVTYDGNGNSAGDVPVDNSIYEKDMTVTVLNNSGDLRLHGFTFTGWNTKEDGSGDAYSGGDTFVMGDENVTLHAQWTIDQFAVTFDTQGGSDIASQDVGYGSNVEEPTDPTRTGHTFQGWYADEACTDEWNFTADEVTDAMTLFARWAINEYTVSFNSLGGSAVASQDVDYEGMVVEPTDPTRTGYGFQGWYTNETCTDEWNFTGDEVTDNMTLFAKWELNRYTVNFNSQGGGNVTSQIVGYGGHAVIPTAPVRAGHTFIGWYREATGSDLWNFATGEVTEAITLFAHWTINEYTVSFNSQGGGNVPSLDVTYGESVAEPERPTYSGYVFRGWFRESSCENEWVFSSDVVADDTELFALWVEECSVNEPVPQLSFDSVDEDGRIQIPVENWADFSPELFRRAPELEPCGANPNASRTWVDVYDAETDVRLYGFCSFGSNESLRAIWFSSGSSSGDVYVLLIDRACEGGERTYKSNTVHWQK